MIDFCADVTGHDDDCVTEINCASLAVGHVTVVHDLQQCVPDLRVGLFDLVEEQHLIRPSADLFGELAALLVANIAWRGAKEFADGVSFAIFAHIDSQKCVFAVEEEGGQDPGQFSFADAGGPKEEEGANGPAGVFPRPLRALRIASLTASMARSWPIIRSRR